MNTAAKTAHLIANTKSGKGLGSSLPDVAKKIAAGKGVELTHYPTEDANQFERQIDKAVAAAKKDGGIVIAAGGDGTIRSVADKAARGGVNFAAVPCGTFNFFARAHRIPEDTEEALNLALSGEIRPVRLGKINDHYFLINASLGLYAQSIKEREKSTKRFGRARLVVILSTIKTIFKGSRSLLVDMITGGKSQKVRTISIFIGNNALQLRDLAFDVARCMKMDLLAVLVVKPLTRWDVIRIIWRGLAKTIEKEEKLDSFCVDSIHIDLPQPYITVALDGEMFQMQTPLKVTAEPEILKMVLPPKTTEVTS